MKPVLVLKFGGSVLREPDDYPRAVHEIYRHFRRGRGVVAVVSASCGTTDRLVSEAGEAGADSPAAASLLATGERASAARLALALERSGIPNVVLDPQAIGFVVRGPAHRAVPEGITISRLAAALEAGFVVVLPGFFGERPDGTIGLLGRGGSDLTAVVVARALGARCRLIKDVGGVYPSDPSQGGRIGRPFARLGWDEAERLAGRVIQAEALRCARDGGVRLEVGGLVSGFRTRIGAQGTALAARIPPRGRLRVVLLGLGTVGRGVLEHLERMRDRFEVVAIAVRRPERHEGVSPHLLTTDAVATAAGECDVVVEMLGGEEPARSAVAAALAAGHDVVSANKLVMATGVTLRARCSAAVGGAVPMLETVRRLRRRGRILMIEAVLNGTTNFILDCLRQGASFAGALAEAQRLGYAEADPALDLDGTDAALKLVLLARAAFGKCSLEDIVWNGIPRSGRGGVVRLVARTWKESGGVRGVIGPQRLHRSHPLAAVRGADNAMIVHSAVAGTVTVWGRGAGRWPTAEAVVSDLLDLWRLRVERRSGREVGAAEP